MQPTLTEAVLEYKKSKSGLDSLINRIALFVYRYPRLHLGWNEDDCGEFFCYFFPKLPKLIGRFDYHGKPFEVYLIVTLKWQLRTYAGQRAVERLRLRMLAREGFWAHEGSQNYQPDPAPSLGLPAQPAEITIAPGARAALKVNGCNQVAGLPARRRILFLTLKCAGGMTEELIARISLLTGYDREWIGMLVEELKIRTHARQTRLRHLAERRNASFFRIYCLHEQIRLAPEAETRAGLTGQLLIEKSRLETTLLEISRVPVGPTHRDIAEVLGIPKGTVDSGIYYMKERLRSLSP